MMNMMFASLSTATLLLAVQSISAVQFNSRSASTAILRSVRQPWRGNSQSSTLMSSRSSSSSLRADDYWLSDNCDDCFESDYLNNENNDKEVQMCSATVMASGSPINNPLVKNLARGAFLRVISDLTGGTPLENIKTRVTATTDGPIQALKHIVNQNSNGVLNLWSGSPSRTVEGSLMGAAFMVASVATKKQVLNLGGSKTAAALAGGVVGGVIQSVIMTPTGLVFCSLNLNRGKPGYENDTSISVAKRIIDEKGIQGMFIGGGPMALRQASNWASRSLFTEICRTNLRLSRFGIAGEIASGAIGGVGSCWNTPIETVRVLMQRDVSSGIPPKPFMGYINDIQAEDGVPGLFRGVTPRAVQAIWQTVFMVVVPNMMGI